MDTETSLGSREPLLAHASQQSGSTALKFRKYSFIDTESLSYEPATNKPRLQDHKEWTGRRHLYGFTGHKAVTRMSTILTGMLIGLTAVAIQASIERLELLRNALLQGLFLADVRQAVGAWAGISIGFVLTSGTLVQLFAPKAAGAGVTLVMAFLNGVDIRGLLSVPVFVLKVVGLVCSRMAGLAVGPEGPMVHIGACVASLVCSWEPWFLNQAAKKNAAAAADASSGSAGRGADGSGRRTASGQLPQQEEGRENGSRSYRTVGAGREEKKEALGVIMKNSDHREMVSAGAAAGIAAAFGAPIGGVLFSLEEAATHWSRKVGWTCFLATTAASFTLAQLHPRAQSGMLSFKADTPLTNRQWLMQSPFIILVSICGGLLGTAFNLLRKKLWPIRASRKSTPLRVAEAAGVALASVLVMAALSFSVGRCLPVPKGWEEGEGFQLTCPKGHYNDLATAFLGSDVFVIRTLLNLGSEALPIKKDSCSLWSPCYFSWGSLGALSGSYLLLMALASSLCVPGGLFMPSIMVGGSFGALFGFLLLQVLPRSWDIQPGVYALLCATAVLGGVFRSTFSLVVIVVEGTRGIDFLFGIIMAILVSNLVASRVLPDGVYESELERDGNVYYLRPEAPSALRSKTAEDMMATPVVGLEAIVPVAGVRQLLAATTHNGFPVWSSVDPRDPATGMGRLDGFVLRSQLEVLLRRGAYCSVGGDYMSPPPDLAAFEAALNQEMRAAQETVVMQYGPPAAAVRGSLFSRSGSHHDERYGPPLWGSGRLESGAAGNGSSRAVGSDAAALDSADGLALEGVLPPGEPRGSRSGALVGAGRSSAAAAANLSLEAAAAAAGLLASPSGSAGALGAGSGGLGAGLYLNLTPFMDTAPMVVRRNTLGTTVHHLFLAMSLRHLCVVDARNHVVGIITRKDLDHASGEGWWRINKLAPQPHHDTQLKRHQSWLSISLAAPRRLLSSIQAALSPLASPRGSRRGTPKASPSATPTRSPMETPHGSRSPLGTPRASEMEEGGGSSSRSPFWQPPSAVSEQQAAVAPSSSGRTGPEEAAVAGAVAAAVRVVVEGGGCIIGAEVLSDSEVGESLETAATLRASFLPSGSPSSTGSRAGGSSPGRPPVAGWPQLGRVSPRRRHPLLTFGGGMRGSAGAERAAGGGSSTQPPAASGQQVAPSPFRPLSSSMDTIEENREQAGAAPPELLAGGEAVPRWARAISKRGSVGMEAFGSIAFAEEEGEKEAEEDPGEGGTGAQQQG